MMTAEMMPETQQTDLELVSQSLAGNRDAFGQIVARYQNLICSLAYSATGSLSQSQDLSQETFVIAWKKLSELHEPEKLRSWLCGIVRNRIYKTVRQQSREPVHAAETLEAAQEVPSHEPIPSQQTITREEEDILWRAIERIPETYREPLVLFYREHQSVEHVATALELSEDAVKQRLSRGRKLLHEQVIAFVEGALEKTSPGKPFAVGVLAALPMAATSAQAAPVVTALAKGGGSAKSAVTLGSLGGFFAMLGGAYVSMRAQADDTKSPREKQFMLRMVGVRMSAVLLMITAFYSVREFDLFHEPLARYIFNAGSIFVASLVGTVFFAYGSRRQREIQMEDGTFVEAEWTSPRKQTDAPGNLSQRKSKSSYFKSARFMAFGLVLFAMMLARAPWKEHLGQSILLFVGMALTFFVSYHSWLNRPRYHSLLSGWVIGIPIITGLCTLLFFNLYADRLQSGLVLSNVAPSTVVIIFNLVVGFAYSAFIGILFWKRKNLLNRAR